MEKLIFLLAVLGAISGGLKILTKILKQLLEIQTLLYRFKLPYKRKKDAPPNQE